MKKIMVVGTVLQHGTSTVWDTGTVLATAVLYKANIRVPKFDENPVKTSIHSNSQSIHKQHKQHHYHTPIWLKYLHEGDQK